MPSSPRAFFIVSASAASIQMLLAPSLRKCSAELTPSKS